MSVAADDRDVRQVAAVALVCAAVALNAFGWRFVRQASQWGQRRRAQPQVKAPPHSQPSNGSPVREKVLALPSLLLMLVGVGLLAFGLAEGDTLADRGSVFMFGVITIALAVGVWRRQRR